MAQIITLEEMRSKFALLKQSQNQQDMGQSSSLGPAKVLLFTGVRYERYDEEAQAAVKLVKRSRRKKSMPL